ncbi:alpha-ketoacid dehydrogenase subunit beta [Maridesulfovibrio zosterae]|uniref:alpha-ketoacid dehydrogenase subunit beta n=1 Tax=Maridesulfovibrio zosterae TaxID=82171 RepID=UPI0003FA484A|nr:alpha-ketoacid dehydrogenase subunit beta [Maridesulfovibrio zosterae]
MPWSRINLDTVEHDYHSGGLDARRLSYAQAINESLAQALEQDKSVYVMGQGVDDPSGMFGATLGLDKTFGSDRVFDTPLAETALTGIALGSAIAGMRPVYFHNRPDFLTLAMDQILNHASKWHYMFGGAACAPMVIWACVGRGWGSAAQHSQALQGLFMHIPGLKMIMPSTCYDTKGLMLSAIKENNPVLIIEHRLNFRQEGYVPEDMYTIPLGRGAIRRKGKDVTVLGISHLANDAFTAATELAEEGIDVEVIDPRTLKPFDEELVLESVKKTGKLVIADTGWRTGGVTAEIAATIAEKGFEYLKAPIKRVTAPDLPTPSAYVLEEAYYAGVSELKDAIRETAKR